MNYSSTSRNTGRCLLTKGKCDFWGCVFFAVSSLASCCFRIFMFVRDCRGSFCEVSRKWIDVDIRLSSKFLRHLIVNISESTSDMNFRVKQEKSNSSLYIKCSFSRTRFEALLSYKLSTVFSFK
jgi:hypothetical protein